jgi:hypothetical protein
MEHGAALRHTASRLTRMIRQRRALFYGVRGLAWGLCVAVLPVALRAPLGRWALPAAAVAAGGGALLGILYGLFLRVPTGDALGLADRTFELHDRLRTALDLLGRPDRSRLAAMAIDDADRRASGLDLRRAVPWRWPRELRLLPVPVLVLVALPYLPPIPMPEVQMPALTPESEEEAKKAEQAGPVRSAERAVAKKPEPVERVETQEHEYLTRQSPENREHAKGDLAAAFKDTNVATKRPDFSSFLKQGDDRIRMLERVDRLPDLQRDFTQSQYKVMFRKQRQLMAGLDPRQLSPERLRQLLDEMGRMGRRSQGGGGEGDWGQELMEGSQALEQGQMSRAMDAMERALQKMRAMEDRERGGKSLDGGRNGGREGQQGGPGGPGEGEPDFGEGRGSMPGKGTNPGWRGDPTARLGQDPLDLGVEGQTRKGRKESYDTNLMGRGSQNPSRLPSMSVVTQYRKMMEEALAKEAIPLDYRSQVKDYFQALEER